MTDTNRFRTIAKDEICRLEKGIYGREITHEDIQVVFMAYVLGQMKSTMVVAKNTEGRYYVTAFNKSIDEEIEVAYIVEKADSSKYGYLIVESIGYIK